MNTQIDSEKRKLYIALSYCSFLKGSERLLLARTLDTLQALTVSSIDTLSRLIQRTLRTRSYKPEQLPQAVEKAEALMKYCRINMTFYDDADFPPLLREIPDAPFLLYYRGVLPQADTPAAAIVGTRRPTGNGMKAALQLGAECGHAGIPVISGLARGIDTFAHRGALEGGGLTTAVLACGLDRLYPQSNARLAGSILERGGCIQPLSSKRRQNQERLLRQTLPLSKDATYVYTQGYRIPYRIPDAKNLRRMAQFR